MHLVGRYHYSAIYNEEYGEHEIDYCFLIKKDIDFQINESEVSEAFYISYEDLYKSYLDSSEKITPWFKLFIKNGIIKDWFNNLDYYCSTKKSKPEICKI